MSTLPTNRTTASTAAEHVADHNTLHAMNNELTAAIGVRLRRAANQSIPNNSPTVVSFDTEDEDTSGYFPGTGTTITIPAGKAGIYAVSFKGTYAGSSMGNRWFFDVKNGSENYRLNGSSAGEDTVAGSVTIRLAAAATITVDAYQASGGAKDLTARIELWRVGL